MAARAVAPGGGGGAAAAGEGTAGGGAAGVGNADWRGALTVAMVSIILRVGSGITRPRPARETGTAFGQPSLWRLGPAVYDYRLASFCGRRSGVAPRNRLVPRVPVRSDSESGKRMGGWGRGAGYLAAGRGDESADKASSIGFSMPPRSMRRSRSCRHRREAARGATGAPHERARARTPLRRPRRRIAPLRHRRSRSRPTAPDAVTAAKRTMAMPEPPPARIRTHARIPPSGPWR